MKNLFEIIIAFFVFSYNSAICLKYNSPEVESREILIGKTINGIEKLLKELATSKKCIWKFPSLFIQRLSTTKNLKVTQVIPMCPVSIEENNLQDIENCLWNFGSRKAQNIFDQKKQELANRKNASNGSNKGVRRRFPWFHREAPHPTPYYDYYPRLLWELSADTQFSKFSYEFSPVLRCPTKLMLNLAKKYQTIMGPFYKPDDDDRKMHQFKAALHRKWSFSMVDLNTIELSFGNERFPILVAKDVIKTFRKKFGDKQLLQNVKNVEERKLPVYPKGYDIGKIVELRNAILVGLRSLKLFSNSDSLRLEVPEKNYQNFFLWSEIA